MLKILITSMMLVACHGQLQMPQMGGGGVPASAPAGGQGMFNFGRFAMNFNLYTSPTASLQQMCNDALLKNGGRAGDYISDVMGRGVNFMLTHQPGSSVNPLAMVKGPNSAQWGCLLQGATNGFTNMGNIANGVADYFDTVVEHPIRMMIENMGIPFNPCETVFCGENGMTPLAMMNALMTKLTNRQPLGHLGSMVFGSRASMFDKLFSQGSPAAIAGTNTVGQLSAAGNPMMNLLQNLAGSGSNPAAAATGGGNMWQQAMNMMGGLKPAVSPASSGNPMMDIWKQMAASLPGSSLPTAGNGNILQQMMMGGGLKPPAPPTTTTTTTAPATANANSAAATTTPNALQNPATTPAPTSTPAPTLSPQSSSSSSSSSSSPLPPPPHSSVWGVSGQTGAGGMGGLMAQLLSLNPRLQAVMQALSAVSGAGSPWHSVLQATTSTTQKPTAFHPVVASSSSPSSSSSSASVMGNQMLSGMGTLNSLMSMMLAHQAMQDPPDMPPVRSPAMMMGGTGALGAAPNMPTFNPLSMLAAQSIPTMGAQQTGGLPGLGNIGGNRMLGDMLRMMG